MKLTVAFIFGGRSVEHEISVITANQAMCAASEKYNVIPVYIAKSGEFYTGNALLDLKKYKNIDKLLKEAVRVSFITDGKKAYLRNIKQGIIPKKDIAIDVAFPVIHGTNGEDGSLQGFLEILKLPYVGCDVTASANGMDKVNMKFILKENNVSVLDCVYFYGKNYINDADDIIKACERIGYPLIVKPANLGSSIGIKKANSREALIAAIEHAGIFSDKILVERAIERLREINCSVMGDVYEQKVSPCEEPVGSDEILSYSDKYMSRSNKGMSGLKRKIPADLSDKEKGEIQDLCRKTFKALGCRGVARIDCMIDTETGQIYVNEINTIPGSLSFYLWKEGGLGFDNLIDELISLAFKREREKDNLTFSLESKVFENFEGAKGTKYKK